MFERVCHVVLVVFSWDCCRGTPSFSQITLSTVCYKYIYILDLCSNKWVEIITIELGTPPKEKTDLLVYELSILILTWFSLTLRITCAIYQEIFAIQIKICVEYRDMLPRPRLVCQEPGLRPYIFLFFLSLCGFGWELCRTASRHSALCHCPL